MIQLNFTSLSIEGHPTCAFDNLTIYDGDDPDSSPLIGAFCGSDLLSMDAPYHILSNGPSLYLVFRSDNSVRHNGFGVQPIFLHEDGLSAFCLRVPSTCTIYIIFLIPYIMFVCS